MLRLHYNIEQTNYIFVTAAAVHLLLFLKHRDQVKKWTNNHWKSMVMCMWYYISATLILDLYSPVMSHSPIGCRLHVN